MARGELAFVLLILRDEGVETSWVVPNNYLGQTVSVADHFTMLRTLDLDCCRQWTNAVHWQQPGARSPAVLSDRLQSLVRRQRAWQAWRTRLRSCFAVQRY